MIHRTFRSLDEAPKLVGFTIRQWMALIAGSVAVLGLVELAHLPTKPAITLCVFAIGLPAALTYVAESGGLQISVLLRSMCAWRLRGNTLTAACAEDRQSGRVVIVTQGEPADAELQVEQASSGALEDEVPWERWG